MVGSRAFHCKLAGCAAVTLRGGAAGLTLTTAGSLSLGESSVGE